jgi:hypothetical protein
MASLRLILSVIPPAKEISRIYLGEEPYTIHGDVLKGAGLWNAHPFVRTLITLGTPHVSVERWTRKNLDFVKIYYAGAFHPQVRYVCVAGKSVFGKRGFGTWLAYKSYELTVGKGETWGDGITPIEAAHLDGAENLVLEGVPAFASLSGEVVRFAGGFACLGWVFGLN